MHSQRVEEIPDYVVDNIRTLLHKKFPDGYDIPEVGRNYFSQFKTYVYPEKYGLTWYTLLQAPKFNTFCQLYNSGASVKFRQNRPPPVINQDQLRPPEPVAGPSGTKEETMSDNSSNGGSTPNYVSMDVMSVSSSEDSYVSGATHVTTSAAAQSRLDDERNKINWIPREHSLVPLTFSVMLMERCIAPEAPAMYIDCTYCERRALEQLMDAKGYIKRVSAEKFAAVRNRYNEFEFERGAIFHHGAAIKMANIDALMEYGLSNPKDRNGANLLGPNELLYFADIYGGPGGTAEYFLWKRKWHTKGFGISPRGKLDYNLLQAEHYPRECFEPYYGDDGVSGTGDVSNPYNVSRFARFVRECTDGRGVHFAIANGGDRNDYVDEDQKEVRCKYLFLSELLCALQVVRPGGHYICRIYDSYTPFTVGLIYLMYRSFDEVAIFKPESSLPASSERYVICKWRKTDFFTREIINYLSECHKVDWLAKRHRRGGKNLEDPADIVHLVSRDRMKDTRAFCDYIFRTNTELGRRQYNETRYLLQKMEVGQESDYVTQRLRQIQLKCNDQWQIPKKCRQKPKYSKASTAELRAMKLVIPYSFDFYRDCELKGEMELTVDNFTEEITNSKEWFFMTVGRMRGFYLCLGGTVNYHFGGAKWTEVNEKIELMNNTLVYADLVDEIKANGANQSITTGFHIIDALILGGNDIRNSAADERYDLIQKYAKSMNKPSRPDLAKIRAKPRYELQYFLKHMEHVEESDRFRSREGEGASKFLAPVQLHHSDGSIYCPEGLVFMKSVKEKFAPADAMFCLMNRFFWQWNFEPDLRVQVDTSMNGDTTMESESGDDERRVTTVLLAKHFAKIP